MMYQDIFTVPAELRLFIIEKQGRRTFMTKEDVIVLCEEAIAQLEYVGAEEGTVWNNLLEIRAYLVNQGD